MEKCEYCGKNIGLTAVRYIWIDKENKIAVHDKCLEGYKKNTEKKEKSVEETPGQKEEIKPVERMVLSKILGIIILIITIPAVIWSFYVLFRFENTFSYTFIFAILLYLFCIFLGIELMRVKKKGGYYQFLLVVGILFLVYFIIMIVISMLASIYVYLATN
jgi:preprotein translocase subunit SecF